MKESLIYGLFGGLIGSLYMGWVYCPKSLQSPNVSFAVVDMQILISKKSQQLAKKLALETLQGERSTPISQISIQEAANCLKEDLKAFAATNNLILLAKGAVVSGDVPDKTQEILSMIEQGDE